MSHASISAGLLLLLPVFMGHLLAEVLGFWVFKPLARDHTLAAGASGGGTKAAL